MKHRLLSGLFILLAACAGADASDAGTSIDASGDTIAARTPAMVGEAPLPLEREIAIGQPDGPPEYSFSEIADVAVGKAGEIYVWDNKERALRLYDAQGKFVRQVGRTGSGPGEYDRVNGIAVRDDGKLAVWDAGNGRINLYSAAGDYESMWSLGAGFFTGRALASDTANNLYLRARVASDSTQPLGKTGLIRLRPDGVTRDSLLPPEIGPETPTLRASNAGGMSVSYGIPYLPTRQWTLSPHGYFVAGPGDPYVVYALPPNAKPTKIERAWTPVPVDPADKAEARERTLYGMRMSFPQYQWDGPDIPDRKPAYRSIIVDLDGRIWLGVSQPSEKIPAEELAQAAPPPTASAGRTGNERPAMPARTWREPAAYDVFAATGQYLGHVRLPPRTTLHKMRGNSIWAVTLDSLDLPAVTRYRIGGRLAVP